jgi:type IV secretion system protein VirD4
MGFLTARAAARAAFDKMGPPPGPPPAAAPPPGNGPTPIKFGYYHHENGQLGAPNNFEGERHCLVFGLNGAGKSTRLLIELMMTTARRSLFVFDTKGELAFQTAPERRKYSTVKIINPCGVLGMPSDGFNPLAQLEEGPLLYSKAADISDALIEIEAGTGQHWSESAQGLLTALLMDEVKLARAENRPASLLNVRLRLTEADEFEDYVDADGKAKKRLKKGLSLTAARLVASGDRIIASLASRFVRQYGQNELSGIQSTAATQTEFLLDERLAEDLVKDGTDVHDLRRRPTTIFLVLPPKEISRLRRWTRVVLAAALSAHFTPGPISTLFVLDEFRATVGKLQVVNDMWSLVRGYGCQLMPICQSALQLKTLFQDEWENYAAQAGAVLTLGPPGDLFTAKWMSERCGTTTVTQSTFNANHGFNRGDNVNDGSGVQGNGATSRNRGQGAQHGESKGGSLSLQLVERRAFTPQELMNMLPGEGRIWMPGMGSESIPFYAPPYWRRRAPWVASVKPNPLQNS